MRALKVAVVVMGILIVVGLAVIAATIIKRTSSGDAAPASSGVLAASSAAGFAPLTVSLPSDSMMIGAAVGDGKLVIQAELGDGTRRLVVVDLASGRELGRIDVRRDGNP